jgi:hypothetical protein
MRTSAKQLRQRIDRKAKRGFRGYPVGTIAYYGPDDRVASKVVAAVIASEDAPAEPLSKWVSADVDVRSNAEVLEQVLQFLSDNSVRSVAVTPGIYGCPHEEGMDYPEGESCQLCPFWVDKDRNEIFRGE